MQKIQVIQLMRVMQITKVMQVKLVMQVMQVKCSASVSRNLGYFLCLCMEIGEKVIFCVKRSIPENFQREIFGG